MNLVEKYLNLNNSEQYINLLELESNKYIYQNVFKEYLKDPNNLINLIIKEINDYFIKEDYNLDSNCNEINYYIDKIVLLSNKNFRELLNELKIDHLLKILEYNNPKKINYYKLFNDHYYTQIYKILVNKKINNEMNLHEFINNNWTKINFIKLLDLFKNIGIFKYFKYNTSMYEDIISEKFDNCENIKKLINYLNEYNHVIEENISYSNYSFIIDNLKSNGILFFQEFFKYLKLKYNEELIIEKLKHDETLVYEFIKIISKKEHNNINRFVNELLLKIKYYINDLIDNYNNNIAYKKINIKLESDKFKNIEIADYNRNITNFKILKYNYLETEIIKDCIINNNIDIFISIYKSYYKSRFPDRFIDIDLLYSTIIIKLKFDKLYYIHLTILQYIVLDLINKNENGILLIEINNICKIPFKYLELIINSLLKIQLIKKNGENINNLIFILNKDFESDNKKISICSLIQVSDEDDNKKITEFLHDKKTIILCNIIDFIKKNSLVPKDILLDQIKYKIPFKIEEELFDEVIELGKSKEYLKVKEVDNNIYIEFVV